MQYMKIKNTLQQVMRMRIQQNEVKSKAIVRKGQTTNQTSKDDKENQSITYHKHKRFFTRATKAAYIEIILNKRKMTSTKMAKQIVQNHNIILPRTSISQFWLGEFSNELPSDIINLQEYKNMLSIAGKRTRDT